MRGFTLIELLIVIGTIGVMAGIVIVGMDPVDKISAATDAKVQRDVYELARAMDTYYVAYGGRYPPGPDFQQELIDTGQTRARFTPPISYTCDDAPNEYLITVGEIVRVSCELHSKKFNNLGFTHWVWCSHSGRAGPTNGSCP